MTIENWTPKKSAIRISNILDAFSSAHGTERFPVDVLYLATHAAELFDWDDPITEVTASDIKGFEGCLFPNDTRSKWMLLYNNTLSSQGRVRFTQAHELGHYILHRHRHEYFECSSRDMLNWSDDEKNTEAQADLFASYILMPLNDFRRQVNSRISLDLLGHCADRYGVSLTSTILKWLSYTSEKAVLLMSNDGFINWAWSSNAAFKAGAFFKTRTNTIPVPDNSLAANDRISQERSGTVLPANVWFKHAQKDLTVIEMKITADQYDSIITLLLLPDEANVWPSRTR